MKPIFFFDADGVTLKTDLSWLDPFDLDQQAVTDFFVNEFIDCVTGKTDLREVLPKHLERRGWKHGIDRLIKYWFQSQNSIDGQIVWLVSMLRKQGYACYLVTQQEKHRAEYMRSEMKLDEVFDQIVTTADIGYTKREEEFFTEVCRHLGIEDASQVFFVDDSKKVLDVAGSIGITTFLYDENFAKLYSHIKNLGIDSIRV